MKKALCVLAIVAVTGLIGVPPEAYAQGQIKVLSDGPLQPALVQIGEAFGRESGHQVEFTFGTSPVIPNTTARLHSRWLSCASRRLRWER
jgi:ABC-type molybdate transport system substrate-binding protein